MQKTLSVRLALFGLSFTRFSLCLTAFVAAATPALAQSDGLSLGKFDRKPVNSMLASPLGAPTVSPASPSPATASSSVINIIEVSGNQRVETQTVKSYLNLTEGNSYTAKDVNAALKRLFQTGFFSDIKFSRNGGTLTVYVVENPIVNRVVFEGNDHLEDDDLKKEVVLQTRSIYTKAQVQNDVKRLLDLYRASGRYSATVTPKVVTLEQNRVNLVYEINEGPVTNIQKISFVGNEAFSDTELLDAIRSQEAKWYRFFSSDDRYDADRVQYDQELLRRFYVSHGYADFQVKSAVTELTPDKQGFYLTFTVEEGQRYRFGAVKLDNRLTGSDSKPLEAAIKTKTGEIYNSTAMEDSVDQMVTLLGDQGYAFVDVAPDTDRDTRNAIINVTYKINEGPRVYVERININGNTRTLDEVVRREFRLAEGDAYNNSKLRRSEQRINNLGYFENVKIAEKKGSAPDKIVLDTNLQERSTGELTFGVGFSTADGPLADLGVREKNLMGRGQDLRARLMVAAQRQQIDLGFTEPYFLNRDIAAGFDVYRVEQDLRQESSYDRMTNGFTLRANYALSERWRHTVNYNLRQTDITNVSPFASTYIKLQEGESINSSIGQSFAFDARNNRFDPTSGGFFRLSQEYAGIGGDSHYLRHEVRGEYYIPLAPKWTVQLLGQGGHTLGLKEADVRIQDRFFIGGREVRGFNNAGIGPRDAATQDALGGNIYYAGTLELRFPLGLPEEMGFSGAIFTDFGSLWRVDNGGAGIVQSDAIRASAGVGLAWSSPFGPIRIDFAQAYAKQPEDETELVRFNFGTRF